jgi:hypothetical protein
MYACKLCGDVLSSKHCYVQHCRLHTNVPRVRLPCCYQYCLKTSSSFDGLRKHISREHRSDKAMGTELKFREVGMALNCGVVSCKTVCSSAVVLVKHLHQHMREGLSVECPIKHCQRKYKIRSSFASH